MAVQEINSLTIEMGTYFEVTFNLFEPDNSAAILSGFVTAYSAIRKHSTSDKVEEFSNVVDPTDGTITISLTEEQTSNLSPGRNYFDIVVDMDGKRTKVIKGTAIVAESMSV